VADPLRLALDQNFPLSVLKMAPALPEVELVPIRRIDRRLGELDDRSLIIALYQLGWSGLVTNNYKMLYVPAEIAAIVKTKLLVFAVEGVGHDPLRATGALLLDLPGALKRYQPGSSQVFRVKPRDPRPAEAWTYLAEAARRIKVEPDQLYSQVRVSDEELLHPMLGTTS
jgi:hypothetical protein